MDKQWVVLATHICARVQQQNHQTALGSENCSTFGNTAY